MTVREGAARISLFVSNDIWVTDGGSSLLLSSFPALLLYLILSVTRDKSFIIVKTDVVFLWVFAGFLPVHNLYGDLPIQNS